MYLISEERKNTKTGGKGLCQVFQVKNLKTRPIDLTEYIAHKYGFEYKKGYIVVHYGSGTGFMRIQSKLYEDNKKTHIFAISNFRN